MRMAQVRKAKVVHVRSWQIAYRGHMPDEFLDSLDVEKRTNMWRELTQDSDKIIFVAEDSESNIEGFSAERARRRKCRRIQSSAPTVVHK